MSKFVINYGPEATRGMKGWFAMTMAHHTTVKSSATVFETEAEAKAQLDRLTQPSKYQPAMAPNAFIEAAE